MRRQRLLLLVILASLLTTSCATNPVTGRRELTLMTETQEIQLGTESDASIVAQYGLVQDEALAAYVASIGSRMVPVSHRPEMEFHFRLLDDPVVNAFALPGGYVYITRGILAYLNDEGALAGVIGHEVGHVTARHGVQRYTQQAILGLGLGLGAALSETFAKFSGVAGTAGQLLMLKYGRDDERQSDELGVEYATKIGYDTTQMGYFFDTLARLTGAEGRLPSWASTHPDPGERYQTVLRLTQQWQTQVGQTSFQSNRDSYLRRLEGLPFGDNPRQGYVDNGAFLHPDLKLRFPVPSGWQVMNSAAQVAMVSPEQDAAVIFRIESGNDHQAAASRFARESGVTVSSSSALTLSSGWPGTRVVSSLVNQQQEQRIVSTFVQVGSTVYVFHGFATAAAFEARRSALTRPADGFAPLTDPAALAIQPVELRIVAAGRSGTFRTVVADHPIPARASIDVEGLALLNGLTSDAQVAKGQLLKVLVQP